MLDGFVAELESRKRTIEHAKTELESVYAKSLSKTDQEIGADKPLLESIQKNMAALDAAFTSLNGTLKSTKQAIDTQLEYILNIDIGIMY